MSEKTVQVIVAAHKPYRMPADAMYLPVQVGATGKAGIGFQRDDEGENISAYNPYFCELTGLYWAWKNRSADYLGLAHYRRHFSLHPHAADKWSSILTYAQIRDDLESIRVFVPRKRWYCIETLYSHYAHTHYASQLDETRKILVARYPEYAASFDRVMRQRWGYMFNMMILEHHLFDAYCKWLFEILFALKGRLGEEGLTPFHSRYYGRISEILFNVWLHEAVQSGKVRKEEIREIPFVHMGKIDWRKKGAAFLKAKFAGKKYEGSF